MTTVDKTPPEPADLDALFALALREHGAGRLTEAAAAYHQILAARPEIAEVHNNLAILFCQQGLPERAVTHFEQAIALKPTLADAHKNLANVLRQQGQLERAAAACRQAVTLRPDDVDSLYNLTTLLRELGKLDEAAAHCQRVLALKPGFAEAHNSLAMILASQNRLDEAADHYRQALAIAPGLFNVQNNLANVLRQQGQLDEAITRYRQAIALKPDYAEAHGNLGGVLWQLGRLDEAVAHYEQAIAQKPELIQIYYQLAKLLSQQGRHDEAAVRYRQLLARDPGLAEAHNQLGLILAQQAKLEGAAAHFEQAIALTPNHAEAYNNLGSVLWRQEKLDEAAARIRQALAVRPNFAEAHNNLGSTLAQQDKLDEAAGHFQQAIALTPNNPEANFNLGKVLLNRDRLTDALEWFQRAVALRPDYAEARFAVATCHLLDEDYERGWPEYEARLHLPGVGPPPDLPRWNGEPLTGRSLLLVGEAGLGDTIQFLRFARVFKALGARVVLAAQAALGPLLAGSADWDELFLLGSGQELPRCDFYLPLLSAPGALGTRAATIPCEVPYLAANAELTRRWRDELAPIEGLRIGIVWQGSRGFLSDRWRSLPLAQLAPLARVSGVRLVSLQKGFGTEQIAAVDFPVVDLSDRLDESTGAFMDTAAVIRNLDLVIAPDTAIGHLAGALGAAVWLALPVAADWRWLQHREDSPWYPATRLFRQTTFGDWPGVFRRMARAAEARLAQRT